jgi:voltage-gated potassium channel
MADLESGPGDPEVRPHPPPPRRSLIQDRAAKAVASRRVFPYLAGATIALAIITGALVRIVDRKDFHSFGEGVWWAIVTLATVGYGDIVPTTPWGRVIGSIVIVFGVTFLAFLTATVTSLFVSAEQEEAAKRERQERAESEEEMRAVLRKLDERLAAIEAKLDRSA